MRLIAGPAAAIAASFAVAIVASTAFIGVASHDLGDVEFGEVAFAWLTVGAAPAMLCLGTHLLLQRTAARHPGEPVSWEQFLPALAIPLGLTVLIGCVAAVGGWVSSNRYTQLAALLVPVLLVEIVRIVAGEAARVVAGPLRTILTSGQARVVLATALLLVLRWTGVAWTTTSVLVVLGAVSAALALGAIRQCGLTATGARDARPSGLLRAAFAPTWLRQLGALSAVSAAGVVLARMPLWSSAIVPSDVVDEIAIGLTFFTLFSQPQAITNLALTDRIARASASGDRAGLRSALFGAIGVNTAVGAVMLAALAVTADDLLPAYAGERAESLTGVAIVFATAGAVLSATGPGALILQFEGRDRPLFALAAPTIVAALVVFPLVATAERAIATGVALLVLLVPYNVAMSVLAYTGRRRAAGSADVAPVLR